MDEYTKVINEWKQMGGVLNYVEKGLTHEISLYIMDDYEFKELYNDKVIEEKITLSIQEFAKEICETALYMANIPEDKIKKLMDWD